MYTDNIAKQIIEFQKSAFDNSYDAIVMLQDQAEGVFNSMIGQAPWIPQKSMDIVDDWTQVLKTGRDAYKNLVDDGFESLVELCTTGTKPAAKTKSAKSKTAK
jgi:hypothetical protein